MYACGSNEKGQLGLASNDFENQSVPKRIEVLTDKTITMIKAGSRHSAALSIEGYCYAWGANDRGQLGILESQVLRKEQCVTVPIVVESMLGRGLSSIYCRYH